MKYYLFLISLFGLCNCSDLPLSPPILPSPNDTLKIPDDMNSKIEGMYSVTKGKEYFGDSVVGKCINNRLCFYSKQDVIFSVNTLYCTTDSLKFKGYIRIVRSGSLIYLNLNITRPDTIDTLINSNLVISGDASNGVKIELKWIRKLNNKPFMIMAHRGGGRNSERLGVSENSLEMLKLAQYLGATGVEIDVKRTRDGQIIVFHDDTFSPRTVKGVYLLGKVENYDLAQIKLFGRLINGEEIPTLEKALETVIDSTILSLVWIDVKDPQTVHEVKKIQSNAIKNASRNITIVIGIPTKEIMKAFGQGYENNKILIEYDHGEAYSQTCCLVWAPRWTGEIKKSDIEEIKNKEKYVFTWTLDFYEYVSEFFNNSNFNNIDGILTNYPSLIAGFHY